MKLNYHRISHGRFMPKMVKEMTFGELNMCSNTIFVEKELSIERIIVGNFLLPYWHKCIDALHSDFVLLLCCIVEWKLFQRFHLILPEFRHMHEGIHLFYTSWGTLRC